MSVFKRRGFQAHKEESDRREKMNEAKRGKLFGFFLKDGEVDVPIRFLTEEPILWYRHRVKEGNNFVDVVCLGDDCEECAAGDKPTYTGSWLVSDGREFKSAEYKDGKKTGKEIMVKDRLKMYSRGNTDIAKLDLKSAKWKLTSRPWFVSKTGTGQSTSYELERGETSDKLTTRQMDRLIEQLPDKYRDLYVSGDPESLYAIVEAQIYGLGESEEEEKPKAGAKKTAAKAKPRPAAQDEDEEEEDVESGVQSLDEEEEEEPAPRKPAIKKPGAKPAAKPALKPAAKPAVKPAAKPAPSIKKPAAKPLMKRK